MVTDAEAALWAFGLAAALTGPPPEGTFAGALSPASEEPADRPPPDAGSRGVPAPAPSVDGPVGEVPGSEGTVGVVDVVVVVAVVSVVVVPASCAAEIAGMAQLIARTSTPLARALAPFIHRIVRVIDS
jgi:hypothetical protein